MGGAAGERGRHPGGMTSDLWPRIQASADRSGLAAVGVCDASVLEPAATVLPLRKARGLAGSMQFTYRRPQRSSDPGHILPDARSIVVAALDYGSTAAPEPSEPAGRVAVYAWRDHYAELRSALAEVAAMLETEGHTARVHLDDNHLVDRNVAHRAGLGWYGKNANLLLPGTGSWYVLGSVVTDAELAPTGPPPSDGCGPCTQCIDACPTDAIVAPGIVDATRCIAWIVQGPGEIPEELRPAIGDRLYGCDDCQTVCPPNLRRDDLGPPPDDADPWIELSWVLTADDAELLERVGRWYIADRDPNVVRRTALVVLGNTADGSDPEVTALLEPYLDHPNPMLRSHARWAAARLDGG